MTRLEELHRKRGDILTLATKHGARNVRVFGSVVRGEERPDSDVDLLVDMEPGRSYFDLIQFSYDAEDLMHCRVDVLTPEGISRHIKDKVLKEARSL